MKAPLTLSAVLPAFNEAGNLEAVVIELRGALERLVESFEIIVVDDGSRDRTGELAARLRSAGLVEAVVSHPQNRGYGAALRSGFVAARLDWIFFMDADGQLDPADLAGFLPLTPDHDLIAGFRRRRNDPPVRRLYGRLFTRLSSILFGVKSRDLNCAFKLFRRSLITGVELTSEGALINAELLARLRQRGARMAELPVNHRPRASGSQTGGSARVIGRALREMLELRRRLRG